MIVMLKDVRLAFPDLFEPKQFQSKGDFSYGCQLLIKPGTENFNLVEEAIKSVALAKWGKKAEGYLEEIRPDKKACCWIDGKRRSEYDGYAGHWSLTAKRKDNKGAPLIINRSKQIISRDKGEIYGGCFVNAKVDIYASENSGLGIRCELHTVQYFRKGEAFGSGGTPTDDEFDDLSDNGEDDNVTGGDDDMSDLV